MTALAEWALMQPMLHPKRRQNRREAWMCYQLFWLHPVTRLNSYYALV